jgi:arabinoxylan arabinofuranohydrolase
MKNAGDMDSEASGYRSIGVDKATVNESTQTINKMTLTRTGVTAIANMNPYQLQEAETMASCGGISYEDFTNILKNTSVSTLGNDASRNLQVKMAAGSWTQVRRVDFGTAGASKLMVRAKGEGTVEFRFGRKGAKPSATFDIASDKMSDYTVEVDPTKFTGQKTIYIVVTSGDNVYLDAWQATEAGTEAVENVTFGKPVQRQTYDLSGRHIADGQRQRGVVIEQYTDERGVKKSRKHL